MKFTAETAEFANALTWVAKALPARPSQPVLAGIKVDVCGVDVTLSAFDFDQSAVARVTLGFPADEDGTIIVSGRMLADIVRAINKPEITFRVEDRKLHLTSGAAKFSLALMGIEDYPTLPEQPDALGSVEAAEFAAAISRVIPAAGRDDMLPVLTAVSVTLDAENDELVLAATDRFRLSVVKCSFKAEAATGKATYLVPARVLDMWAKSLTSADGRFVFGTDLTHNGVFAVDAGTKTATVRLLDGTYPNWSALIPAAFSTEAVFAAPDLIGAVRRVALVASKATPVTLAFTRDGIEVSAAADDTAAEHVECALVGDEVTIGFNIGYLIDGLNGLPAGPSRACLGAKTKPAIFRPADDDVTSTYLLMPMRGQGS